MKLNSVTLDKRRKQRKFNQYKNVILSGIIIFAIAVVLVGIINIGFNIGDIKGEQIPANKTYQVIVIKRDDTLWSIANEYKNTDYYTINKYIKEVKQINNLKNDIIIAGTKLTVPIVN